MGSSDPDARQLGGFVKSELAVMTATRSRRVGRPPGRAKITVPNAAQAIRRSSSQDLLRTIGRRLSARWKSAHGGFGPNL